MRAKYKKLLNKLSPKLKNILEKDIINLTFNEIEQHINRLTGNTVPFCEKTKDIFNKGLLCTPLRNIFQQNVTPYTPRGLLKTMFGVEVAELNEHDYWQFLKIKYGWFSGT